MINKMLLIRHANSYVKNSCSFAQQLEIVLDYCLIYSTSSVLWQVFAIVAILSLRLYESNLCAYLHRNISSIDSTYIDDEFEYQ